MRGVFHKQAVVLVLVLSLLSSIFLPYKNAFAEANPDLDIQASAAILVEAESGKILYAKNIDAPLAVASMTKMMTEYLVHEAVEQKKISWDQKVTISEYAHLISQNRSLSNVPLENGGSYSVKELYEAMAIYSANGATIALGELISGSETAFIKLMNEKAKKLGMANSAFVNATGLSNRDLMGKHPAGTDVNDENRMSAKDCAILAQHLIAEYPELLKTTKIPRKIFQEDGKYPIKMENWNWMLPELVYAYEGVDGLKTGSTPEAGFCFTGTAKQDDMRLITVIIKADSYKARFDETKKLLDYGFSNFEVKELYPTGYSIKDKKTIEVLKGKEKEVKIQTADAVTLPIQKGSKDMYTVGYKFSKEKITAPVKKDEKIGYMTVRSKDQNDAGFLTGKELQTDLITDASVEKANWFVLTIRNIGSFFGKLWTGAADAIKGLF